MGENGWADTGPFMGWVHAAFQPWIYSAEMARWMYVHSLPDADEIGHWIFLPR